MSSFAQATITDSSIIDPEIETTQETICPEHCMCESCLDSARPTIPLLEEDAPTQAFVPSPDPINNEEPSEPPHSKFCTCEECADHYFAGIGINDIDDIDPFSDDEHAYGWAWGCSNETMEIIEDLKYLLEEMVRKNSKQLWLMTRIRRDIKRLQASNRIEMRREDQSFRVETRQRLATTMQRLQGKNRRYTVKATREINRTRREDEANPTPPGTRLDSDSRFHKDGKDGKRFERLTERTTRYESTSPRYFNARNAA